MKPHLPALGPKLGKELGAVRAALAAGEFEELDGGRFRVLGYELEPDEVLVERGGKEGWAVASGDGVTVALDLALDDELLLEGDAYDLIHRVNTLRKEQGFELTRPDRPDRPGGSERNGRSAPVVDRGRSARHRDPRRGRSDRGPEESKPPRARRGATRPAA